MQGALGLSADDIAAIFADAGAGATTIAAVVNGQNVSVPNFSLDNLSICYRYGVLAKCLGLKVSDMIALKAMSGLNPFQYVSGSPLSVLADDVVYNQTVRFVKQVEAVQRSGFTVEDLRYLLRHNFDPVGQYQTDPNPLLTLVQSVGGGLQQIETQNATPSNPESKSESLIDQSLSGVVPAEILKNLVRLLTNSQTLSFSQTGVPAAIDPVPFAQEPRLTFNFDPTTQNQTVSFHGFLLDWQKVEFKKLDSSATFSALLDGIQSQGALTLNQTIGDVLGVWASLTQYESVKTGVAAAIPAAPLLQVDPAISLSYDQSDQLQWLGYRGVLTDSKKMALRNVNNSANLQQLLDEVQAQALPGYRKLLGTLLVMCANVQTWKGASAGVPPANQVDTKAFFAALSSAQQAGTITDPVPTLEFSYDAASQVQTLSCEGVLTESMRGQLTALAPGSVVLANLLQAVRGQATQLFQVLSANLLTVSPTDLDEYAKALLGVNVSKQQKEAKVKLLEVFLPLVRTKLSRQLILQTLSSNLSADSSLTEVLASDSALLTDPSNQGKSLMGSFLSLGQQGVSAWFYASSDGSGPSQASGTASTTDTGDPVNNGPAPKSAHFEGYLQVSTDGPYRFIAQLGNAGATARFQLDPPDPTPLLKGPVIPSTPAAANDHDELSQFVQLKGGVLYHFTLDFASLGANGAGLLIQGEGLPKGSLRQVVLYPQQSVTAFIRAYILLAKVLQILRVTSLGVREISYLVANSTQFNNLKLGSLPTQPGDDAPDKAIALFAQFTKLAAYAELRKGPAGGTDGLVDVFQAASLNSTQEPNTPWTILANLTRRDSKVVQAVAKALGSSANFSTPAGIRRIWQALQMVQIIRIPVDALAAATAIVSISQLTGAPAPDVIATNFKNAVKAQYTAGSWRPIAQSMFDKLRKKKRDALVAYLVNKLVLDNSNQLFEYFLVDPGMEPVVQTSRLRLALSSVQTFVQRCLLNLESGNNKPELDVLPGAIDADWWAWMKRYRVWQANREIFLFPENWMEPELRLDKTDLFQTLESALLQGDATVDLVEDAFLTYLKGLESRARLDIIATYLEQDLAKPGLSILHVLGRTYGHPHKYFYRTYSTGTWSGWEVVTPDIEGDHIVLAVWRGRLNVFWVTFIPQAQAPSTPAADNNSQAVSGLSFNTLAHQIGTTAAPQTKVQVQLHWSECFQGKWSNRISTDVNTYDAVDVDTPFIASKIYIHVSKETDSNGNEGAVRIHLDFPTVSRPQVFSRFSLTAERVGSVGSGASQHFDSEVELGGGQAFRVTSKNCAPDFSTRYYEPAPDKVYSSASSVDATFYTGSGVLQSTFQGEISSDNSRTQVTEPILQSVHNFAVLTCANPVVPSAFLDASEPLYKEAGSLIGPFFYKDTRNPYASSAAPSGDELTFFVQPSLTETTIHEWKGWAIAPSGPLRDWSKLVDEVQVEPQVPVRGPVDLGDPVYSVYPLQDRTDWVTHEATAISYGDSWIGKSGGISPANIMTAVAGSAAGNVANSGITAAALAAASGIASSSGFTFVGREGLDLGQLQTIRSASALAKVASFRTI